LSPTQPPGIPRLQALAAPLRLLSSGFVFSLANLALVVMFRISPLMTEWLTGAHAETGYFDLALGGLLLIYTLLGQVAYAFVPILTNLHLHGQRAEALAWLGRVVRYSTVLVGLAAGGMWAVAAPIAPLLFGADFAPAASVIRVMAFGLLPLPLAWAGVTLTALDKRPHAKLWAALLGLTIFVLGAWLLRGYGASGIAGAFALALAGYAAGYGSSARLAARSAGLAWVLALLATALFLPLFAAEFDSFLVGLPLWAGLGLIYLALASAVKTVSLIELRPIVRALRRG
jgi:PST family polysaccharide transporter